MKKSKFFLSATGFFSVMAGVIAFKAQHKFGGNLLCTTVYGSTNYFRASYTAHILGVTAYCTITALPTAAKYHTTLVILNASH